MKMIYIIQISAPVLMIDTKMYICKIVLSVKKESYLELFRSTEIINNVVNLKGS